MRAAGAARQRGRLPWPGGTVAWRRAVPETATGPAAEVAGYAAEVGAAAGRGDRWAADRLASARSWVSMLGTARGDEEVAELFAEFARCDRETWRRVRGGVAQA